MVMQRRGSDPFGYYLAHLNVGLAKSTDQISEDVGP